jgi:hypothetical protein
MDYITRWCTKHNEMAPETKTNAYNCTCNEQHVMWAVLCQLFVLSCILVFIKVNLKFQEQLGKINYEFSSPFQQTGSRVPQESRYNSARTFTATLGLFAICHRNSKLSLLRHGCETVSPIYLRLPYMCEQVWTTVLYRVIKKSLCTWWLQYEETRKNILNSFNHLPW